MVEQTDRDVAAVIRARQAAALGRPTPVPLEGGTRLPDAGAQAYAPAPDPTDCNVPPAFVTSQPAPETQPAISDMDASADPTTMPAPPAMTEDLFTLTESLAYAQQHRRAYQNAKEDLYLSALSLMLERHLWTPIFAGNLRAVYGNYGEAQNFDQAMRFVADLSVSQRLPYGGEFTAQAVGTLVRDVGRSITAQEQGEASLGLDIPLLRGAGHVARETLIQLERELTYSVRTFERFRRQQLVTVAQAYFDLLLAKQRVASSIENYNNLARDFEQAKALQEIGKRTVLDTKLVQQRMLTAENQVAATRESFRAQADQFKLLIGMPVDEPMPVERIETIESVEQRISEGEYALLRRPPAVDDQSRAVKVAIQRRFDLLTLSNRIEDARRGVEISQNALLPDLNWTTTLDFDTDPNHYNMGAFEFERANWRSEIQLELPLERTRERHDLRRSLIEVRQAQRTHHDQAERIRAEVRRAVNTILLAERSEQIQRQNVAAAESRREFAEIQFKDGEISNRDKVEAVNEYTDAVNNLNAAKTDRWTAILEFRLVTETLCIDESGRQVPPMTEQELVAPATD